VSEARKHAEAAQRRQAKPLPPASLPNVIIQKGLGAGQITRQATLPGVTVAPVWDPLEDQFQSVVIEAARTLGWIVAHFRPALTKHGYRTPVSADGKGFPDLELVGRGRILHRELKRRHGPVRPEQEQWGVWINQNGGDWAVWRPQDWPDRIIAELDGRLVA
jgi:hypothetical protein